MHTKTDPPPRTHIAMEHYKKKQSVFFEEECLPNELRITATGKAYDLTTRATHRLKVADPSWAVPTSILAVCEYRGERPGGLVMCGDIR